jgi:hypothetical protein
MADADEGSAAVTVAARALSIALFCGSALAIAWLAGSLHGNLWLQVLVLLTLLPALPSILLTWMIRVLVRRSYMDPSLARSWLENVPILPMGVGSSTTAIELFARAGYSGRVSPGIASALCLCLAVLLSAQFGLWRLALKKFPRFFRI